MAETLIFDEAERQRGVADDALRQIGDYARGLLRPRNPDRAVRFDRGAIAAQFACEPCGFGREHMHHIERRLAVLRHSHIRGQFTGDIAIGNRRAAGGS